MSRRGWVAWTLWVLATVAFIALTGGLHEIA